MDEVTYNRLFSYSQANKLLIFSAERGIRNVSKEEMNITEAHACIPAESVEFLIIILCINGISNSGLSCVEPDSLALQAAAESVVR